MWWNSDGVPVKKPVWGSAKNDWGSRPLAARSAFWPSKRPRSGPKNWVLVSPNVGSLKEIEGWTRRAAARKLAKTKKNKEIQRKTKKNKEIRRQAKNTNDTGHFEKFRENTLKKRKFKNSEEKLKNISNCVQKSSLMEMIRQSMKFEKKKN